MKHSNHLINETSPYLLQHAHNPVDWYPWGDEALNRAKKENKPILVSIGYAACHWCHVMERESFEDEATAAIMNEHFINIKIDREERPDLDHIYMDAVQAISGSGGWPLNVFLTPEAKPFYGGTYFPPIRAFNRSSWKEVLASIHDAFQNRRHEIDAQAENLTDHIVKSNSFGFITAPGSDVFNEETLKTISQNLEKQADKEWGGFGKAPKFPQTFSILYLLRYTTPHLTPRPPLLKEMGPRENEKEPVKDDKGHGIDVPPLLQERGLGGEVRGLGGEVAHLALTKMIHGGIYDQIGGGFARYSTDTEWLVPHFEKMLYDNALLISVISEAYQLTNEEIYLDAIKETMKFIEREMLHPDGGFYSALDADSEGVEGKFYVWEYDDVKRLLKEDAELFSQYFDITQTGNWEHKNILRVKKPLKEFALEKNIEKDELKKILEKGKRILLEERAKRIRPLLDDKIILGWNALMNTACSKAFTATMDEKYKELAVKNMEFIFEKFPAENKQEFFHTWKNDQAKYPAFLDDYAYLVQALIHLQEITGNKKYLEQAKAITEFVMEEFSEKETGFFFYTSITQSDVILRKKEVYDGAVPSGNAVMAWNLYYLSIIFDRREWQERSVRMLSSLSKAIKEYPTSFGVWASLLLEITRGTNEIAIVGKGWEKLHREVLQQYIPHRVLMASQEGDSGFPLLKEKQALVHPAIYLCRNYTCASPVFSVKDLMSLINNPQKP